MPTIICFSTVDWDHLWYHPQALMSQFAQDGYRVVYVDTVGLRSPKLRDLKRIVSRFKNWYRAKGEGVRRTEGDVLVFSPFILPFLNSRLSRWLNVRLLVYKLNKIVKGIGSEDVIFWVYLPTWTVWECVRRMPHGLLIYNSIDALSESPYGVSRDYATSEMAILKQADVVFTTSETLYREKVVHNANTYWVPPGVASGWFEAVVPAPEVTGLPAPRIGFFGAIDHRIDLALFAKLAQRHREWTFVLIGAVRGDVSFLEVEKNIHFLGAKPHADLARYVSGLDVIFLPYVVDAFTRHIQPAKLFECMAVGKPVVATRLPALEPFEGLVRLAEGLEAFEIALAEAIAEDRPDLQAKRREIARDNSWEKRYREIVKHVRTLER